MLNLNTYVLYSELVNTNELVAFDKNEYPYKALAAKNPYYSSKKMVKLALQYMTTGEAEESFKWAEWLEEEWIALDNDDSQGKGPQDFFLEGRKNFYHSWSKLMDGMGLLATETLKIGQMQIDFYQLYRCVMKKGGMEHVTKQQLWRTIYEDLDLPPLFLTSNVTHLKTCYKK